MKKKKTFLILIIITAVLIAVHLLTYFIDYSLITKNKNPAFSIPLTFVKDGGTIIYYGFGYQIIRWHFLKVIDKDNKEVTGYMTGYEINHFIKFIYKPFPADKIKPGDETKLEFILK